jgi:hypothetical protein
VSQLECSNSNYDTEGTHVVLLQRSPLDGNKGVDGERFGVLREAEHISFVPLIEEHSLLGDLVDETNPVLVFLSKSEDTARADRDTGIPNSVNGSESLIVRSRSDDGRIEFSRGVKVMVVCAQSSILQSLGLLGGKHAKSRADYPVSVPL